MDGPMGMSWSELDNDNDEDMILLAAGAQDEQRRGKNRCIHINIPTYLPNANGTVEKLGRVGRFGAGTGGNCGVAFAAVGPDARKRVGHVVGRK